MMPHRMHLYLIRMCELDSSICLRFNRTSRYVWVRRIFRLISRLGDGIFWYTVLLGILMSQGTVGFLPSVHIGVTGLTATAIYVWLKRKMLRPRPYEVHQDISLTGTPLDRFSFPSGHTLHAVAFSMVTLAYYPALTWLLLPFTFLVALSRVILGLHYPSDVIAGAGIGASIAYTFLLF